MSASMPKHNYDLKNKKLGYRIEGGRTLLEIMTTGMESSAKIIVIGVGGAG